MKLSDVGQVTSPQAFMVGNQVRVGDPGAAGGTIVSITPGATTVMQETRMGPLGPSAVPASVEQDMAQRATAELAAREAAVRADMQARQMAEQQNLLRQQASIAAQRAQSSAEEAAAFRQFADQDQARAQAEANRIGQEARARQEREEIARRAEIQRRVEQQQQEVRERQASMARQQAEARAAMERMDRERREAESKRAQELQKQQEAESQRRIAQQLQDEHSKLKVVTAAPDRAPTPMTSTSSSGSSAKPSMAPMPIEQYRQQNAPLQVSTQPASGGQVTSVEPPAKTEGALTMPTKEAWASSTKMFLIVGGLIALGLVMSKNKQ